MYYGPKEAMHPVQFKHLFSKLGTVTSLGLAGTIMASPVFDSYRSSEADVSGIFRVVGVGSMRSRCFASRACQSRCSVGSTLHHVDFLPGSRGTRYRIGRSSW
jgi:hypothetical protein